MAGLQGFGFLLIYKSNWSSSGPGRLVLIQKIKGSTPFGITNLYRTARLGVFSCSI